MKILIVDDSKAMRMIVKRTLRQAGFDGHDVVEAQDGADGLEAVRREGPDLVLSDWNMPEKNGLEFLQGLRAGGDETPFGFITSEATPEMKELALGEGALFLITKPFTPDSFRQALEPVVG